jgi:hypothetical protein
MPIHPWWASFGPTIATAEDLTPTPARALASALATGKLAGVALVELKQSKAGHAAVRIDVDVERPQDLAFPIKATEPIAVVFPPGNGPPSILALREDFPDDPPHQNWTPEGAPCSLCIDDRPWAEAKLTWTPADLVRRVQLWLAKCARGELHDPAQPLDPLFFRSELALLIPAAALTSSAQPAELIGFMRPDNPQLILTRPLSAPGQHTAGGPRFVVLAFRAAPQAMSRFRHAPITLAGLAGEMAQCGVDLLNEIKARLTDWAGLASDGIRRLSSQLAIVVAFPVTVGHGRTTDDLRAFVTLDTAGEIGVALGILLPNESKVGAKNAYMVALTPQPVSKRKIEVQPAEVHVAFNRDLASSIAGRPASDRRPTVLIGVGALGSQLSVNLAREGAFSWSIVDKECLLPHNLARHSLFADDVGAPKAPALAARLGALLDEPFPAAVCDVTRIDPQIQDDLTAKLGEAEIIIDASASVAVSRYLSDLPNVAARRLCAFFNPAGTAVVLLAESRNRTITLRDLEAQYHRLVVAEPQLAGHLRVEGSGIRYSGSCRALTNRIPATSAALLSAVAARGIVNSLKSDDALIQVWMASDEGEVRSIKRQGACVHQVTLGSWAVAYDDGLMDELARLRAGRLPNETGGVLLGIADMSRKSIHVAHALPQPEDSHGSVQGFERGVVGLLETVTGAVEASMHQLRYVGEWHSHPRRSSPLPSTTDLTQLEWLAAELEQEGLPGLMAIAADNGRFAFVLAGHR